MVHENGCDGGADLSACEWVCSASCDHVYISRQASAAHRTHNNKNTTKHRSEVVSDRDNMFQLDVFVKDSDSAARARTRTDTRSRAETE